MKSVERILFCVLPAVVVAIPVSVFSYEAAYIVFLAMFMLGISVTKARPDRGEG